MAVKVGKGGKNKIHEHPNACSNGLDKNPQNIYKGGGNRNLISAVNLNLKAQGYEAAKKHEITETFLIMLNLPLSKVMEIAKQTNDEYPMLYKIVAKELRGKRGATMLERMLDRAIHKPTQSIDIDGSIISTTLKVEYID
jgi:hypothetical protein